MNIPVKSVTSRAMTPPMVDVSVVATVDAEVVVVGAVVVVVGAVVVPVDSLMAVIVASDRVVAVVYVLEMTVGGTKDAV